MMYDFQKIEKKWREYWSQNKTYKVEADSHKPKFYVLDMFPYPSGAGLHVGHPLGYIASDIYARFKKMKGFNVLHPMGYDAFGLPAEQYAIQTGKHPAATTQANIARYREQLDRIGFGYDWDREIRTCDPKYYKWTQWAFLKLFGHWYNNKTQRAEPIDALVQEFERSGNAHIDAATSLQRVFTGDEWRACSEKERQDILLEYRLAYLAETTVNWCPALGTVLANDEVKDGFSERGGHPVVQKKLRQWSLRITAYADRLLEGLNRIDWSDALKEMQRNWIGRSEGAQVLFAVKDSSLKLEIFTTRPDTIFGVSFMVVAPESEVLQQLVTDEHRAQVEAYVAAASRKTERERMAEAGSVTGQFTGAYAIHPFTGQPLPIWTSEYVLAGYGTGAIMAVPAHDSRDYAFAKQFGLPIVEVVSGGDISVSSYDAKDGILVNSDFINGLSVKPAQEKIIDEVVRRGLGKRKINFRLRDAVFSRQRYWGEPFPIYYKDGVAYPLDESLLPLELPEVDAYLPTESGEPPLGRAKGWHTQEGYRFELDTMPGFAGSSAYYLRYMDPHNDKALVSRDANEYWRSVDLYVGGKEHATGHLLYSRFWNKFLFDIGLICEDEPFKKLINQGMIQGESKFVYRDKATGKFISRGLIKDYDVSTLHVDVNIVENDQLDIEAFRSWRAEYQHAEFVLEENKYLCGTAVEKMSKSLHNVVNPDTIIERYGADTLRLYEMFLGPIEQSKPWSASKIEGVHRFLKKLWRLFHDDEGRFCVTDEAATPEELKLLYTAIKKCTEDIENFSFNTAIAAFMVAVNGLGALSCQKRAVLTPLIQSLAPFIPHAAEELWQLLGHNESITRSPFPLFDEKALVESVYSYPISFNGKLRFLMELPLDYSKEQIQEAVLADPRTIERLADSAPKKIIIVPSKIVNIVH
jgi:leucyl-tRNA synthetase